MNHWRMRMRKGNGGSDMFEQCLIHGVAAIHYNPVESVDLSRYSESDLPDPWSELENSQSGSLKKFAWRIKGGDTIYVAESYPSRLVGVGRVRGTQAVGGYHYDPHTPIIDDDLHPWRHLVHVEWEQDFEAIRYPNPYCAQATVLDLQAPELRKIQTLLARHRKPNSSRGPSSVSQSEEDTADEQIQRRELEDWAYTRYTSRAIKTIQRRHVMLCKQFTQWLTSKGNISYRVERRNIDLTFQQDELSYLVEFKIAYSGDPKPAIREALGQILEYNHYPRRKPHDHWILVLDCQPTTDDLNFLGRLRLLGLPLAFGWPSASGFEFSTDSPIAR
jgi:hypothetical protein